MAETANIRHGFLDVNTGHNINYKIVEKWPDGSVDTTNNATNDTKCQSLSPIFRKNKNGEYIEMVGDSFDIRVFGAKADGITDDILAFEKAIDLASKIGFTIKISNRTHLVSRTIKLKTGVQIVGLGAKSVIKADAITGPVIQTHDLLTVTTNQNVLLSNFNIIGTGDCAVAWTHVTGSRMENITMRGFTGENGFVFESCWFNTFGPLSTDGGGAVNAGFLVGKVFLDATFELLYTSNASKYNVLIDSEFSQYSNNNWEGWGTLAFKNITLQGAKNVGMWIKSGHRITFDTVYNEAVQNMIRIGDSTIGEGFGCGEITFNQLSCIGGKTGATPTEYGILFDRCWNITINNLHSIFDIVYSLGRKIQINNARFGFASGDMPKDCLKRTTNATSDCGVTIRYSGPENRSEEIVKTASNSHRHSINFYDYHGALNTEILIPPTKTVTLTA